MSTLALTHPRASLIPRPSSLHTRAQKARPGDKAIQEPSFDSENYVLKRVLSEELFFQMSCDTVLLCSIPQDHGSVCEHAVENTH